MVYGSPLLPPCNSDIQPICFPPLHWFWASLLLNHQPLFLPTLYEFFYDLLSVGTDWCIVRSLAFPTFYLFLTFVIFNIVVVIICKFFISCDNRVLLWVTFWITSLKKIVRKFVWVIMPKISIRCETFLSLFKIIRTFCFPVWHVLPFRFYS